MLHTSVCERFQLIPEVLKYELQESSIASWEIPMVTGK